ncbi:UDP-2,3-diacetamido-2,3-dideoxy-D-glucuronate 2-epimerase [Grimontia celer]|uniref:UDP-2,3-diacetamido-2,3-dideoxy-D-glucuronate 2-epimerase n=1 Tax=Grimontia celer TaxID=1796497 RepID=A0A128F164_9GAMM|nr:UDP-N-acetylglucosamine 2-epimerase (non-hydrolyzing) [Grimontia celer]CZF80170.1 UDP-2,3-diacetamido-2,3-dideoxy-D-glucuronate 2-epimerase [Grimontia celer]
MKIVTILGARPQFIKAGSVSREIGKLRDRGENIQEVLVHTGQHYDANMSDVFFEEMRIPKPDYFLGIGGKSHGEMTGQMIEKIEKVLINETPDWVLVYGDTNSTLAGAIAASKLKIKIAHVEAGLRSYNMAMPEEINRILTDRISNALFCPTQKAMDNINSEAYKEWNFSTEAYLCGDVMLDGALFYKKLSQKPTDLKVDRKFVLCTLHRAENTDDINRISQIIDALSIIAQEVDVILPLHPRTKKVIEKFGLNTDKLVIIDPVGYLNMVWLIDNCKLVMTDSGGLQKEAFFFGKHCLTMRDETEWVELVDNGFNILVGASKDQILKNYYSADFNNDFSINLYGDGKASYSIIKTLQKYQFGKLIHD